MGIKKTEGLILSCATKGESDVVASILTSDGKINGVFRGLKKSHRRDSAAMYPGSLIEFTLYKKSGYGTISDFSVLAFPSSVSTNLSKSVILQSILEFLIKITVEDDPHHGIYEISAAAVKYLDETEYPLHLFCGFLARCIKLSGILPPMQNCSACQTNSELFILDISGRGLLCSACSGEKRFATHAITRENAEYISNLSSKRFTGIDHSKIPKTEVFRCAEALMLYAEKYFRIRLNSADYMKKTIQGDIK